MSCPLSLSCLYPVFYFLQWFLLRRKLSSSPSLSDTSRRKCYLVKSMWGVDSLFIPPLLFMLSTTLLFFYLPLHLFFFQPFSPLCSCFCLSFSSQKLQRCIFKIYFNVAFIYFKMHFFLESVKMPLTFVSCLTHAPEITLCCSSVRALSC